MSTRRLWAPRMRRLGNDATIRARECRGLRVQIPRDLSEGSRPLRSRKIRLLHLRAGAGYPVTGGTSRPSKFSRGGNVRWCKMRLLTVETLFAA